MPSMAIKRRQLILGLGAGAAMSCSQPLWAYMAGSKDRSVATGSCFLAARKQAGVYQAVLFNEQGADIRVTNLPERGHSFAIDPVTRRYVAFGRQPGFYALIVDANPDVAVVKVEPAPGRHFYGHGVFSEDGTRLYATENDFEAGRGVVGVYDVSQAGMCKRLGELDTHGIGPHELIMMPDGKTLCVANGGLLTHPDYGKHSLNLGDMQPSLVYLDAETGGLKSQWMLPAQWHQLSIRHLVCDRQGAVWFGCQYVGAAQTQREPIALVGVHRAGQSISMLSAPAQALADMRNYVGSVALSHSGHVLATSSPVGGCVVFWDTQQGRYLGKIDAPDGCGVAPVGDHHFLLTSGFGNVWLVDAFRQRLSPVTAGTQAVSWDNHLRWIAL